MIITSYHLLFTIVVIIYPGAGVGIHGVFVYIGQVVFILLYRVESKSVKFTFMPIER